MKIYSSLFADMIAPENLFAAWDAFKKGKGEKPDVARFEFRLEENIFALHRELKAKTYRHAPYHAFYIRDPKVRHIHKASVRDRVLHHAVFSVLNPIFEPTFIANSFSCRIGKGNHLGVDTLEAMLRKVSRNGCAPCFVLKCDIRKYFESIDHDILTDILRRRVRDPDALWLIGEIVRSFPADVAPDDARRGLPIGNLTSQLFANVYLNELDQFVKHRLIVKHYARYTDDFVIIADNHDYLTDLIPRITDFLHDTLALGLHPNKVSIRKYHAGIDFLGYTARPHYRSVRTKAKRRMLRKLARRIREYKAGTISEQTLNQSLQSYLGVLSHANAHRIAERIRNEVWCALRN